MSTSSPMKTIHYGKWIKIYHASKGIHVYPGLHIWCGKKLGHLRFWPLPLIWVNK